MTIMLVVKISHNRLIVKVVLYVSISLPLVTVFNSGTFHGLTVQSLTVKQVITDSKEL